MSGFGKVWPKNSPAAPDGQAAPSGTSGPKMPDQKTLMWLGAGVVALVALFASKGGAAPAGDPDAAYELDTRDTDLYNDLQPELENISDGLDELGDWFEDKWPPQTPTPDEPDTPTTPPPSPSPGGGGNGGNARAYRVKNGDTLKEIAKKFKVPGGAATLYTRNRKAIVRAAKENKHPKPQTTHKLYAGTVLIIPGGKDPDSSPAPSPTPPARAPFRNEGRPILPRPPKRGPRKPQNTR